MQILWKCNIDESKRFIKRMNEIWTNQDTAFVPNVGDDVIIAINSSDELKLTVIHRTLFSPFHIEVELHLKDGRTISQFNHKSKQF